ncbi:DNA-processing protein DprA [Burkholderiaceae bacterium FT117]|uniref:DNA-processing protein DprA n=1 Tax=Zeimonas sediminis TaxID=2944268 RepID=UPI002342F539|nr:DNA-processing protein DprA [Zeimonas sediminis]MCM5571314.1 DNA-processing protein DprA [Zeimonas sediminis]
MPLPAGARDASAPWLRLILTPGIGPAAVRRLLEAFGLPEDVLAAGHAKLSAAIGAPRAQALLAGDTARDAAIEAALRWAQADDHHLVCLDDPRYPPRLLQIADPPPVLFVRGDPESLGRPSIAIVGSRHATQAGLGHARDFARTLGEAGLTVVSGLAQGIDAAAHQGALATRAGTLAVTGTGIDRVYPPRHGPLADAIAANGAVLTELPLGTEVQRSNFPRRNRLIAGLALATLVVEAARQSGSLITARQAAESGREVMAIPGSIHSPLSKGCHQLIREGAKLVESAEDVLVELRGVLGQGSEPGRDRAAGAGEAPRAADPDGDGLLLGALGFDPADLDTLVERTGRPAGEIGARLLELELANRVERLVDGRFVRLN